jgi:hypothetical protein
MHVFWQRFRTARCLAREILVFVVGMVLATVVTVLETFYALKHYLVLHNPADPLVKQGVAFTRDQSVIASPGSPFPRNVSFSQFVSNYLRMVFGQPCSEPSLKHCRAFGASVPHHPTEPHIASHKKTR